MRAQPVPTRSTLGAALLQADQPEQAEQMLREDLDRLPRNAWGLLGLEHSLRAQGRNDAASLVKRQFAEAWKVLRCAAPGGLVLDADNAPMP